MFYKYTLRVSNLELTHTFVMLFTTDINRDMYFHLTSSIAAGNARRCLLKRWNQRQRTLWIEELSLPSNSGLPTHKLLQSVMLEAGDIYGVFACSVKNMLAVAISSCAALMSSASGRKTEDRLYESTCRCKEHKRT